MARGIGLLLLVVPLVVGVYLLSAQFSRSPSRARAAQDVKRAQRTADAVKLQQASFGLEQFHALNGTYAAASIGSFGVKLARADESSYCIETPNAHLAGPNGTAAPGPC
jgi:Tfp pilus assembly protein PilE